MLTIITSTKIYSNFINQVFINAKHIYGIKITIKSRNIFFSRPVKELVKKVNYYQCVKQADKRCYFYL